MKRYIDVDELRAGVDATNWYHIRDGRLVSGARSDLEPLYKAADIVELVDSLEPADVAPVVHAHWINGEECSECGGLALMDYDGKAHIIQSEYCPCCGAKMDEE